jgi:hypothetical protein
VGRMGDCRWKIYSISAELSSHPSRCKAGVSARRPEEVRYLLDPAPPAPASRTTESTWNGRILHVPRCHD